LEVKWRRRKELKKLFDRKHVGDKIVAQIGTDSVEFMSFKKLQGDGWLNDEVINVCFKLLQERGDLLQREKWHTKTQFWTSFFGKVSGRWKGI
jgi:hypothetical protein